MKSCMATFPLVNRQSNRFIKEQYSYNSMSDFMFQCTEKIILFKPKSPYWDKYNKSYSKINNFKIIYLHNINIRDLFKIISMSNLVISPHGTMTVLASYLKIKVIDIFDTNITISSFREFKPKNLNYNFLILKNNSSKVFNKILKFIK